jgi:hypothetical protein
MDHVILSCYLLMDPVAPASGGYVEFAVQLPGNPTDSGLWAATWLEGNLGRAGYYKSLTGQWPYSYNNCPGSKSVPWSNQPGQRISACDGGTGEILCLSNEQCWYDQEVACGMSEQNIEVQLTRTSTA